MKNDAASIEHHKRMYDQASRLAKIGAWECDLDTEELTWTDGVYDLFDLPRGSTLERAAIVDFYHDDSRAQMERMRAEAIQNGGSFTLDANIRTSRGATRWMRLTAEVAYEHGRPTRIFGAKQDITHERELWDRVRQLSERDPLTGLANRAIFEAQCSDLIRHELGDNSPFALALIDLDHFKQINDLFGRSAGDECLRQVAARLRRALKDAIVVARIGSDEFAVLLRAPLGRLQIANELAHVRQAVCRPIFWKNSRIGIGASIGVTVLTRSQGRDIAELFAEADSALYDAKAAGRNMVHVFGNDNGGRSLSSRLVLPVPATTAPQSKVE